MSAWASVVSSIQRGKKKEKRDKFFRNRRKKDVWGRRKEQVVMLSPSTLGKKREGKKKLGKPRHTRGKKKGKALKRKGKEGSYDYGAGL